MKLFPEAWWLSLPALVRKIVKILFTLLALYCAFLFFSFSFQIKGTGDTTATHEHATITIGTPKPWLYWEKTTEQNTAKTSGRSSMQSESGFNLFTRSFGAGVLCLLLFRLLRRIQCCEKSAGGGSA